ncbi:MAG: nucleotidyltransferase domain-containing protein [Candidatus Azobacteroides sp.]|nr:nucleotidyltransferase domain-containing protein [Candidatus Azobacteroides sp.]
MQDRTMILEKLRRLKHKVLPDDQLILFGSQARNDANEESDWDLLILLNKPKREPGDFDNYAYPFIEMGWEFGELISPKIYTLTEWEKSKPSLFYKNVQSEGINIV